MYSVAYQDDIEQRASSKSLLRLLDLYRNMAVDGMPHYSDFNPLKLDSYRDWMAVLFAQPMAISFMDLPGRHSVLRCPSTLPASRPPILARNSEPFWLQPQGRPSTAANRCSRFTARLRPMSAIYGRGWYSRSELAAKVWEW